MTATITELASRSGLEIGYVLFLEGIPYAFTNRQELVGSGVGSWIDGARLARSACRYDLGPSIRNDSLGFRLCLNDSPVLLRR